MPDPQPALLPADLLNRFHFEERSGEIDAYRHTGNGLQVLLVPDDTAPVVTSMLTYRVGSRNEPTGLTGATHFLEHLMFKGTERFNPARRRSIFQVLQRLGARVNATTWLDRTNYYELLPREHLALALDIEADRMRGALLDPEEIDRERTVILNELDRGQNEPTRRLYQMVWSTAFQAHPYRHPTIGWRSDVEHMDRDGLKHFYDTYYWPDNATLTLIGDFDAGEALALVDRYFGALPRNLGRIPEVHTREPEQVGERRVVLRQSGQLGAVMVAFKSPPGLHDDADALDVLATILVSGKNSLLYRELTDRGLTSHLFGGVSRLRDPGLFYLYAMLAPGVDHETVEDGINRVVTRVREEGVPPGALERARTILHAQDAFSRDGAFAKASPINEAIAAGDWRLYTTYGARIDRVEEEQLRLVAERYLVDDQKTVGYYVPVFPRNGS